jgi:plastocyanin
MASTVSVTKSIGLGIATGVLAGARAACGGGNGNEDEPTTTPPPSVTGEVQGTRVDVKLTDFRLGLPRQDFTAGDYTFVATNDGDHAHALAINGPGAQERSSTVDPGQSTTLRVTLRDGTYEIYCPVGNHRSLGMTTEISAGSGTPSEDTTPPGDSGY